MSPRTEQPRLWLCFTVCRYGVSRGAEHALLRAAHTPEAHLLAGQDHNPHVDDENEHHRTLITLLRRTLGAA
ncbi:hypothetical protein ASF56_19250 [Methylobacterium sp. Leaf122]|nr:hypothetical protein ASF33_21800 [Methylobacterium sp. Leaf92]KQQ21275.1 hypothetical protein ASF56_19250 [Methylobacterium sp. Leaf122]